MSRLDPKRQSRIERNLREAQDENGARLAWSYAKVSSTGWGEFRIPDMVRFSVSFVEEPFLTYGNYVDSNVLVDTRFPHALGGVYRWNTVVAADGSLRWTGAWVYLVVETRGVQVTSVVPTDPNYQMEHHFTFAGIAIKDVPVQLL